MASVLMNVVKEEVMVSGTVAASTIGSARTSVTHNIAACAPSSARAVVTAEAGTLLARAGRQEILQVARAQPVLGNLSTAATETSILSTVLDGAASSEPTALRSILPELREQISNAVQQGLEEAVGNRIPRLEPDFGLAETVKQLEEVAIAQ